MTPDDIAFIDGIEIQMQVQYAAHTYGHRFLFRRRKDLCVDMVPHDITCTDTGRPFVWFWSERHKGFGVRSVEPDFGFLFRLRNEKFGSSFDQFRTVTHIWGEDHLSDYLNEVSAHYRRRRQERHENIAI